MPVVCEYRYCSRSFCKHLCTDQTAIPGMVVSSKKEIKVINMQLEHFYGPGTSPTNFLSYMIDKLKNNNANRPHLGGTTTRLVLYIGDVVNAYLMVIKNQDQLANSYSSFQVWRNQLISVKDLMNLLKNLTNSSSVLNFGAVPYLRMNDVFKTDNTSS